MLKCLAITSDLSELHSASPAQRTASLLKNSTIFGGNYCTDKNKPDDAQDYSHQSPRDRHGFLKVRKLKSIDTFKTNVCVCACVCFLLLSFSSNALLSWHSRNMHAPLLMLMWCCATGRESMSCNSTWCAWDDNSRSLQDRCKRFKITFEEI